jgi:pilus assembly protein CpaB
VGVGGLGAGGLGAGPSGSAGWIPPGARDPRRRRRRGGRGRGTGRVAVWRLAAGAGAVALAVTAGALAGRPAPAGRAAAAPGVAVLVAARDLPAGTVPAAADLRTVLLPPPAVPADALPPAAVPGSPAAPARPGATVAGAGGAAGGGGTVGPLAVAVRRGDVLTGRHFGGGWAPAGALRAYTLPVGDGVEAGPLAPGDRVDVLAAAHGRARTVLRAAPVLRLVPGGDGRAALVVVGVTAGQAEALAGARAAGTLTLVQAPAG